MEGSVVPVGSFPIFLLQTLQGCVQKQHTCDPPLCCHSLGRLAALQPALPDGLQACGEGLPVAAAGTRSSWCGLLGQADTGGELTRQHLQVHRHKNGKQDTVYIILN